MATEQQAEPSPENHAVGTEDPLFRAAEAARWLGISGSALNRLRRRRNIKAVRGPWGRWLYRGSELMAYLDQTSAGRTPSPAPTNPPVDLAPGLAGVLNEMSQQIKPPPTPEVATESAPIVRMANAIIVTAIDSGASDAHLSCELKAAVLRCRIDGMLQEAMRLPLYLFGPLAERFKRMADISPTGGYPMLGSIWIKHAGKDYAIRVSCIPALRGEAIALHILTERNARQELSRLGHWASRTVPMEALVEKPGGGLIVVSGPTGSGVTTTAYCLLNARNAPEKQTVALAEVRGYGLEGVISVYTGKGTRAALSGASALQGTRYQDVDTLLLDDLLNAETATLAAEAVLSGTLVIATVAAKDCAAALLRLRDFGMEEGQIARTVRAVTAQRLLRRVCSDCKEAFVPPTHALPQLGLAFPHGEPWLYRGKGCEACRSTGYRGRFGIFEVLMGAAPDDDLNFLPMRTAAITAMLCGETTPEEILRVLG